MLGLVWENILCFHFFFSFSSFHILENVCFSFSTFYLYLEDGLRENATWKPRSRFWDAQSHVSKREKIRWNRMKSWKFQKYHCKISKNVENIFLLFSIFPEILTSFSEIENIKPNIFSLIFFENKNRKWLNQAQPSLHGEL